MIINVESKICPILRAAGFINHKEMCSEECALYVNGYGEYEGCALAVAANALIANANGIETIDNTLRKGVE